ncbi:RHS repeat domain-containing protein [Chryseobacterium sp. PMSZPI]|uniref:RHS repeat domain-containing protein n=1 Tax=Chryseobacterium sp. PMSZPI TaxID=1033900 RepID=UPI000C321694|nr:RHS repeat domain-containing protein [Chryseobacterium sp. PMSZPI]PKF73285.1 hypothetical protein CW752_14765 [Chryseobacterium sp. PMSZPI]
MRKLLLLSIIISGLGNAQIQRNFGDTPEPVPSISSFSSYINTPVSLATGVPSIAIPLLSLPTRNKNIEISTSLIYHTYNAAEGKPGNEVGVGWALLRGGTISRVINGDLVDEFYDDASKAGYRKNTFDDVYYYNIPGNSGKFKFIRDVDNNTFSISNITGNNIKIEYTRDPNTATLISNSFTITDDKGFKYIFNDYSRALNGTNFYFKSAFYLTKILDEGDAEIAHYFYQKDNKYKGSGSTVLLYQNCRLSEISTDFGKLNFEDIYESSKETENDDPYKINSISLSDRSGRLISKYKFSYINGSRRELNTLEKLDNTQNTVEKHTFEYTDVSFNTYKAPQNGDYACPGNSNAITTTKSRALKRMTLPEGGYISYNFEANEFFTDKSQLQLSNDTLTDLKLQSLTAENIFFDTNQSRIYNIHIDNQKALYIGFFYDEMYENQYPIHQPHVISYQIKKAGVVVNPTLAVCEKYILPAGDYTLEIKGYGNGNITYNSIVTQPMPYRNAEPINVGLRISQIRYFDADNTLKKSMRYEYNSFDTSNTSSGGIYVSENCEGASEFYDGRTVLYKNVKEIYGDSTNNLGYTRYYFKMPEDFTSSIGTVKPYYNLTSSGILYKKEVFNQQSVMTDKEETEYVMDDIPGAPVYGTCSGYNSKAAWIKSVKTISNTYYSNGSSLQNTNETTFNAVNFGPSIIKETSAEGKVMEKSIKYAGDLNNIRLINASMTSIPLQTETKINGVLVDKTEIRYDSSSDLQPSSILSFNAQNQSLQTEASMDVYDDKGNLVQVTGKNNIPVTTIWGYYGTQPIAKITGIPYNQVAGLQVVTAAIAASNADADNPNNEANLLQALEALRKDPALKTYSITTYTYDPLIGITNTISSGGLKTSYLYDAAGRLIKVTDAAGKTLKEYQYNYKH